MKNTQYKKFYEFKTEKQIPLNFEIHHLDFNRNNNKIDNLVAIPKTLHQNYHILYKKEFIY